MSPEGPDFSAHISASTCFEKGDRVICVDNLDTGSLENIEHIRDSAFVFRNHDMIEYLAIDEPVACVYHLASPASPIDYLRLPLHTLKVGSYGTHNALGLAKHKRARLLLASTSEVYGDPKIHPQPETYWGNVNPIGPRGVYDEAKRYAEALTMAYHRQQGVDTCIVRIFNTYGPRMRPNDGRAIPTFVRQALEGKPLTLFGDGSQTRSFCYVDDLIRGLHMLMSSHEHLPVNIGNPTELSLLELAETILRVTGSRSDIVHEALPVDDPKVRRPDIARAREVLDWEPTIELEEGLVRTLGTQLIQAGPSGCRHHPWPLKADGSKRARPTWSRPELGLRPRHNSRARVEVQRLSRQSDDELHPLQRHGDCSHSCRIRVGTSEIRGDHQARARCDCRGALHNETTPASAGQRTSR